MKLQFLGGTGTRIGTVSGSKYLRQAIEERHRWPCSVPQYLQTVNLQTSVGAAAPNLGANAPLPDTLLGA